MPISILLIDDSTVARMLMKKSLPPGDFRIREAGGGRRGLELYLRERPDVVFLDLTMPEMDGFETLERMIALDATANVFVVTADVQPKARERVLQLGARAVFNKPPRRDDIAAALAGG